MSSSKGRRRRRRPADTLVDGLAHLPTLPTGNPDCRRHLPLLDFTGLYRVLPSFHLVNAVLRTLCGL